MTTIKSIGAVLAGFVTVVWNLTPHHWYPIALVIFALPCTWSGGKWRTNKKQNVVSA